MSYGEDARAVIEASDVNSVSDQQPSISLLERVKAAFPAIRVTRSCVERSGGDHILLVINGDQAFRFPRTGTHDLEFEMKVLERLRSRTLLAVPIYDQVDPAGRFAGYRFIKGAPLTRGRFAALDAAYQRRALDDIAEFLTLLHDITPSEIDWTREWPETWRAAEFADRGLTEHLPLIARHAPQLEAPIKAFYERYRQDQPPRCVILHGDLVCEHILVDASAAKLTGIIDFGDAALGDPAQDFLGLWSYGKDALVQAIRCYDPDDGDPGLLHRSHNHFIRYRIDQLFDRLGNTTGASASRSVAAMKALLSNTHPTNDN